jgi:hypothetical protein
LLGRLFDKRLNLGTQKKFWEIERLLEQALPARKTPGFLKEREMFVEMTATKRGFPTLVDSMAG